VRKNGVCEATERMQLKLPSSLRPSKLKNFNVSKNLHPLLVPYLRPKNWKMPNKLENCDVSENGVRESTERMKQLLVPS
jgi:hypothetical protein